ncbi:hypothetical protein L1987_67360 [Smallanthus sonchifolius]|uniref:Uncharacterized protein n=1 Tax=Smallanthus sonchifolius TaxID=185202 RepID=A0ACB9B218_9ASTR|nr:hypothetical protein L1987_67360 [Smallanthus sonchifolius]
MVCIRNDLKVHTQELKLGSNDKFKQSVKLQIGHTGHVSRSRFKTFKEKTEVEDGEFSVTLRKEELLDRDNCTWLLINGASSPSSSLKDNGLSGYMELKIYAWLISLLSTQSPRSDSLLNTEITFFDGSRVNPIEEASLVLDQRKKLDQNMVFQENLEEEDVVLWLKNEASDDGSECYSQNLEKKSKSKSKLAYFTDSSDEQSLISSFSSSDYSSEVKDLEEISTDKPLFWPLDSASDWSTETKWDLLTISPRKDVCYKFGKSPKTCLDSHENMDLEKGCNRQLEFSEDSKSSSNMDQAEVDRLTKRSVIKHKIVLKDLLLVDKLNGEGVIEKVLGLGEFDGHEGIESEFNKDEFSLWF